MPIEPRHGQRIPSGKRLARVMARVLRAMLAHARRALRNGKTPNFKSYEAVIVQVVTPILMHEFAQGAEDVRRRVRRRGKRKMVVGVARKDFLDPVLPSIPERFTDPLEIAWHLLRPEVVTEVQRLALDLAGSVTSTAKDRVRNAIREGLQAGDGVREIASRIGGDFDAQRAFTIAQTESSRASHLGQLAAAESTGGIIKGTRWLASSDCCPLCEELNGQYRPLGEPYYVDPRGGPYAVVMAPPRHVSCHCSILEVF